MYLWITICFITVPNYCLLQLINEIYITVLINSKVLPAIWDIGLISTLYPVFICIIINTHLTVQHCPSLFISLSLYHIFILVYRRAWSYLDFAIGLCIPSSNKNIVMSSCLVACLHNLAITFMHELCMFCGRAQTIPWPLTTSGLCLCYRWLQIWDWGKIKFRLYICFNWYKKLGTVYMLKMIQFGTVHWACDSSKNFVTVSWLLSIKFSNLCQLNFQTSINIHFRPLSVNFSDLCGLGQVLCSPLLTHNDWKIHISKAACVCPRQS